MYSKKKKRRNKNKSVKIFRRNFKQFNNKKIVLYINFIYYFYTSIKIIKNYKKNYKLKKFLLYIYRIILNLKLKIIKKSIILKMHRNETRKQLWKSFIFFKIDQIGLEFYKYELKYLKNRNINYYKYMFYFTQYFSILKYLILREYYYYVPDHHYLTFFNNLNFLYYFIKKTKLNLNYLNNRYNYEFRAEIARKMKLKYKILIVPKLNWFKYLYHHKHKLRRRFWQAYKRRKWRLIRRLDNKYRKRRWPKRLLSLKKTKIKKQKFNKIRLLSYAKFKKESNLYRITFLKFSKYLTYGDKEIFKLKFIKSCSKWTFYKKIVRKVKYRIRRMKRRARILKERKEASKLPPIEQVPFPNLDRAFEVPRILGEKFISYNMHKFIHKFLRKVAYRVVYKKKLIKRKKKIIKKDKKWQWRWNRVKHLFQSFKHKTKKHPRYFRSNRRNLQFNRLWFKPWNWVDERITLNRIRSPFFIYLVKRNRIKFFIQKKVCLKVILSKYFKFSYSKLKALQFQFKNLSNFINTVYIRLEFILIRLNYVTTLKFSRWLIDNNYVFVNNILCNNYDKYIYTFDIIEMRKNFDFALLKYKLGSLKRWKKRRKIKRKYLPKSIRKFYFHYYIWKYTYHSNLKLFNFNDKYKICDIWLNSYNLYNFEKNKVINSYILNHYINTKNFY